MRTASITIRRIIQLRPDIGPGSDAIGTSASMKSGCVVPQTQVSIPPIELPMTRRRWSMPRWFFTRSYWAATMSS